MKSIITTYPNFKSLPKGVKIMLLVSENYFFDEDKPRSLKVEVKPVMPERRLSASSGRIFSPWATVALRNYGVRLPSGSRDWSRQ